MDTPEPASPPPLLRPQPRRPFQLNASSNASSAADSHPPTPGTTHASEPHPQDVDSKDSNMERTRSIMNLTSSTLFGIYAPTAFESQPPTPWGNGAETPAHRGSLDGYPSAREGGFRREELDDRLLRDSIKMGFAGNGKATTASPVEKRAMSRPRQRTAGHTVLSTVLRVSLLFASGLAYGALIAHLHNDRNVSPVRIEGLDREGWSYLVFWGFAGVAMGLMLPWIDSLLYEEEAEPPASRKPSMDTNSSSSSTVLTSVEWNDVVRSAGAFIGVAYAIRKTPWSSPLQLSATLALVNPFLWYLLDRTPAGLSLSTFSSLLGVLTILVLNPSWVPSPSNSLLAQHANSTFHGDGFRDQIVGAGSILSHERVGLAIWIGSVFFCSCICFGNVGRLLAPGKGRA